MRGSMSYVNWNGSCHHKQPVLVLSKINCYCLYYSFFRADSLGLYTHNAFSPIKSGRCVTTLVPKQQVLRSLIVTQLYYIFVSIYCFFLMDLFSLGLRRTKQNSCTRRCLWRVCSTFGWSHGQAVENWWWNGQRIQPGTSYQPDGRRKGESKPNYDNVRYSTLSWSVEVSMQSLNFQGVRYRDPLQLSETPSLNGQLVHGAEISCPDLL